MDDRETVIAKCEEILEFLAAHEGHPKLRRLMADIEAYRDRLRETAESCPTSSERGETL